MINIDALIFDLDGTLIDSRKDLARSVQFLQAKFGSRRSTIAEVGTYIGDGVVKLVQRALPSLAPRHLAGAVEFFKKHYREHCLDHTRVYPTVRQTLEHFRNKKLAVVTNKPVRVSSHMLEALRLSPYFRVVLGGDSLPQKKPHPEPIRNALRTMGLRASKRIVVIGDSSNDILAGRAARVLTCGIRSNIGNPQKLLISRPDFVIHRMHELMRIFS